jgi:hypothetical protein
VLVTNPLGISTGLWVVKWNPAKRNIAILTTGHKNNRESLACRYPRQKIVLELRSRFKLLPFLCIFLSLFTLAATVLLFQFSSTFLVLHYHISETQCCASHFMIRFEGFTDAFTKTTSFLVVTCILVDL